LDVGITKRFKSLQVNNKPLGSSHKNIKNHLCILSSLNLELCDKCEFLHVLERRWHTNMHTMKQAINNHVWCLRKPIQEMIFLILPINQNVFSACDGQH